MADSPRRVLVTGAAGRIGSDFAHDFSTDYSLRLMLRGDECSEQIEAIRHCGEVIQADLTDRSSLDSACDGIDTVLHLAATSNPHASWEPLLQNNIIGVHHLFEAAAAARVRRVVFASSIHAVSGHLSNLQIRTDDPVNAGDLYGVSKCFGEATARYMAVQRGLSTICVRIGAYKSASEAVGPDGIRFMDTLITRRDLMSLFAKSIDVENVTFAIVHGTSDHRFKRLDLSDTRSLLDYKPMDDVTRLHPALAPLKMRETILHNNEQDRPEET